MAGPDHLPTTDQMRAMDKLRRQQRILRSAGTRLLKAATNLLETASPHPHELQEAIDLLERNDAALYETEKKIIEHLEHEVERDYIDALAYRGTIHRAINSLRSALNSGKVPGRRVTSNGTLGKPNYPLPLTVVDNSVRPATHADRPPHCDSHPLTSAVVLRELRVSTFNGEPRGGKGFRCRVETTDYNHPNGQGMVKVGFSPEVASSVPMGEGGLEHEGTPVGEKDHSAASAQPDNKKGKVNDVKESVEPPPHTFEYIFVPDFMKEESLPQRPKIRRSSTKLERDAAPRFESGLFCIPEVRNTEPLLRTNSGQRNETPKPCQKTAVTHSELTPCTKASSPESETAVREKIPHGRRKTDLEPTLGSLYQSYRSSENLRIGRQLRHYKLCKHTGLAMFHRVWSSVLSSEASAWRRSAVVKAARRRIHRWKQKK